MIQIEKVGFTELVAELKFLEERHIGLVETGGSYDVEAEYNKGKAHGFADAATIVEKLCSTEVVFFNSLAKYVVLERRRGGY